MINGISKTFAVDIRFINILHVVPQESDNYSSCTNFKTVDRKEAIETYFHSVRPIKRSYFRKV